MPIADSYEPLKSSGNGSTVDFSFDFYIGAAANLRVYEEDDVTLVQTLKALSTDYTVVFNDETPGGTVTMNVAPASGKSIIRARAIPKTQEVPLKTSKGFQALVLQNMIDKVTALVQDVYEQVNRAVKLPLGTAVASVTLPNPEDDSLIAWDGTSGAMKNLAADDFTGPTGPQGPTGATGATGATGPQGPTGPAGGVVAFDGSWNTTNLLANGDFESWSAGASAAPDGWTLSGAGASVARGSTTPYRNAYYATLTRNGADVRLTQNAHLTNFGAGTYFQSKKFTLSCRVRCSSANVARISLSDGTADYSSSYHTGGGAWEVLKVTATMSAIGTVLQGYAAVKTSDVSADFDGFSLVEGESDFAFSPKPAEEGVWADYSAVSTINGGGSFTTKKIYTKRIGKTIFVQWEIVGTSNANTTNFTTPYIMVAPATTSGTQICYDNGGANGVGRYDIQPAGLGAISLYKDGAASAWTTSGTKSCIGQAFFDIA